MLAQLSVTQILLDIFTLAGLVVLLLVSLFVLGLLAVLAVRTYRKERRAERYYISPDSKVTPLGVYWPVRPEDRKVSPDPMETSRGLSLPSPLPVDRRVQR